MPFLAYAVSPVHLFSITRRLTTLTAPRDVARVCTLRTHRAYAAAGLAWRRENRERAAQHVALYHLTTLFLFWMRPHAVRMRAARCAAAHNAALLAHHWHSIKRQAGRAHSCCGHFS